jgi:hypothetical protein
VYPFFKFYPAMMSNETLPRSRRSEFKHAMKSMSSSDSTNQPQSSLLIWVVLILIMLSGVMYLGFKVNQKHALDASSKGQKQQVAGSTHEDAMTSERLLEMLQAQSLVGQLIYKTKIILPDTSSLATAPNRDALWQQGQKQLTLVEATVHVAIDLSDLLLQNLVEKNNTSVELPPARIISLQVDNLTSYDTQSGLPSTVQLGLSMTSAQSQDVELQIEHDLCASGILKTASEDARQHVAALLQSQHISRVVKTTDSVFCRKSPS